MNTAKKSNPSPPSAGYFFVQPLTMLGENDSSQRGGSTKPDFSKCEHHWK